MRAKRVKIPNGKPVVWYHRQEYKRSAQVKRLKRNSKPVTLLYKGVEVRLTGKQLLAVEHACATVNRKALTKPEVRQLIIVLDLVRTALRQSNLLILGVAADTRPGFIYLRLTGEHIARLLHYSKECATSKRHVSSHLDNAIRILDGYIRHFERVKQRNLQQLP